MKNHSIHNSKHHLPSRWRSFVSLLKKWLQYHLTTPAQRHAQWSRRKTRQLRKYKYARFERTIIYYTNKERRKHGLWELAYDPYLNEVARNHSRDMAKNHFLLMITNVIKDHRIGQISVVELVKTSVCCLLKNNKIIVMLHVKSYSYGWRVQGTEPISSTEIISVLVLVLRVMESTI